jgi:hypothetical protein
MLKVRQVEWIERIFPNELKNRTVKDTVVIGPEDNETTKEVVVRTRTEMEVFMECFQTRILNQVVPPKILWDAWALYKDHPTHERGTADDLFPFPALKEPDTYYGCDLKTTLDFVATQFVSAMVEAITTNDIEETLVEELDEAEEEEEPQTWRGRRAVSIEARRKVREYAEFDASQDSSDSEPMEVDDVYEADTEAETESLEWTDSEEDEEDEEDEPEVSEVVSLTVLKEVVTPKTVRGWMKQCQECIEQVHHVFPFVELRDLEEVSLDDTYQALLYMLAEP